MMIFLKNNSYKRIILLGIVLFIIVIDFISRRIIFTNGLSFFENPVDVLRDFLGQSCSNILRFFMKSNYNSTTNWLEIANHRLQIKNQIGILSIVYYIALILIYPFPVRKTITLLLAGITAFYFLFIIRLLILLYGLLDEKSITECFNSIIYSFFLIVVFYKIQKIFFLRRIYVELQIVFRSSVFKSINIVLITLVIYNFLGELIIYFFRSEEHTSELQSR